MRKIDNPRRPGYAFVLPALFSALLAAAPIAAASAQDSAMERHESRAESAAETIDQRIASLHDSLKITQAEETDWQAVAQTMRDNVAAMQKLASEKAQSSASMTAVDDLQTYSAFAQAHVDHLKKLTAAFTTLYNSMPAQQKKLADQVFARAHHDESAEHDKQG